MGFNPSLTDIGKTQSLSDRCLDATYCVTCIEEELQCSTVQYSTVLYCTVILQYSYCTLLENIIFVIKQCDLYGSEVQGEVHTRPARYLNIDIDVN